jgi:hypothetical protein
MSPILLLVMVALLFVILPVQGRYAFLASRPWQC